MIKLPFMNSIQIKWDSDKKTIPLLNTLVTDNRKFIIVVFGLALFIRIAFILIMLNPDGFYFSDTRHFDGAAMSILRGEGPGSDYYREPLYPYLMAAIYYVFGHSFTAMRIFQALLAAGLTLIIYDLGKRIFDQTVAKLSAFLLAFYPYLIVFSGILYTEMVYTTLIAIAIWFLIIATGKTAWRDGILAGLFIGLAALCRSSIFFFLPFLALWIIFAFKETLRKRIIFGLAVFTTSTIVLVPTLYKNYRTYHRVVLVRPIPHTILPDFTKSGFEKHDLNAVLKETNTYRLNNPMGSKDDNLINEITRYIKHPVGAIKFFISELPHFWAPFPDRLDTSNKSYRDKIYQKDSRMTTSNPMTSDLVKVAATIFMVPVYLFAVIGAGFSIVKSRKVLLIFLIILSFTIGYCLIYAEVRYRIPVDPYVLLFTASGMQVLLKVRSKFSMI